MKRRRTHEVDLALLPPIETLIPEELKNYTKEELSAYLQSKGIQPKVTKPEMKRQLRFVLQALRENKPEVIAQLQKDGMRELVEAPRSKLRAPIDFPRPHVSVGLVPLSGAQTAADGDVAMCLGPGCRKKANRECDFTRCRSCCTREGYLCYIHMNDVQRRGNETHLYREHPFVKGTAEVGAYLPLGQRRAHRESIAHALVAGGQVHVQELGGVAGRSASVMTRPTTDNQPSSTTDAKSQTTAPAERLVWMETCPNCQTPVAASGALFILHLRHCCPDILDSILAEPHNASTLLRPQRVDMEEEAEEADIEATTEPLDEEELEPVDKAKIKAAARYKRTQDTIGMIFSDEPPLIEAIGDTILNFAERKACLQRISEMLDDIVAEDVSQQALSSEQNRVKSFEDYLADLDAATTLEEVAALEEAFQAEHSILLHAGNVCPGVHRHELPAESGRPGHQPLPPLQPLSAVTPELVDLVPL